MKFKINISNWKKFGFEFMSIFIAVVAAFALNNWNDSRKANKAEDKILAEISNGLVTDLADIKQNIAGHKMALRGLDYFWAFVNNDTSDVDSLDFHYFHFLRDFISVQNTSGYQNLKSRGLELIENDSLRFQIISLYEYDYNTLRKFEEEYAEMQFHTSYFMTVNKILSPNLKLLPNGYLSEFEFPLKLSDNEKKELILIFWKIKANRNFILYYYQQLENKVVQVQAQIKDELNK